MKYQLLIALAAICCASCATNPGSAETYFGDSVRSMIYYQTANPEAAANPDPDPVMGYNGARGQRVLSEHNRNVTAPEETDNIINLNIGGD